MAKRKPVKRVVDKTVGNRISDLHHRMDHIHGAVAQDISELSKRLGDLTTRLKAGEKRAEPIDWMQERVTKLAEQWARSIHLPQQVAELHEDVEGLKEMHKHVEELGKNLAALFDQKTSALDAINRLSDRVNEQRSAVMNVTIAVNERLDGVDQKIAALGGQVLTPDQQHHLLYSIDGCNAKRAELEEKVDNMFDRVTELERKMLVLADSLGITPAAATAPAHASESELVHLRAVVEELREQRDSLEEALRAAYSSMTGGADAAKRALDNNW